MAKQTGGGEHQDVIVIAAVIAVLVLGWLLFRAEWPRRR